MRSKYKVLVASVTLLLQSCATSKDVPVAVSCPQPPLPPQEVAKSVSERQPILPRSQNSAKALNDSWEKLGDSLRKAMQPK